MKTVEQVQENEREVYDRSMNDDKDQSMMILAYIDDNNSDVTMLVYEAGITNDEWGVGFFIQTVMRNDNYHCRCCL